MIVEKEIIAAAPEDMLNIARNIRCENIVQMLDNHDIPEHKRAFLYNIINDRLIDWSLCSEFYLSNFTYLAHCFKYTVFQKKIKLEKKFIFLDEKEKDFLRKSRSNFREKAMPLQILQAIKNNSVSELEIARLLNYRKISLTMMYAILTCQAENIIHYFFEKYSDEIFSLRTPEEWLFTICNYFPGGAAVSFIKQVEDKFPGIVKNARDPWGCDLLWHTFYNEVVWNELYARNERNLVQQCLIDLGCDPNKKNDLGLSFNLITKNTIEEWYEMTKGK